MIETLDEAAGRDPRPTAHDYTVADLDDVLAREQLREGAHEISDAAADVAGSLGEAASLSLDDFVETARTLIRENPLVAIAAAAGIAYLFARITR